MAGWLGCLERGKEEGSESEKSREGENRNPKSKEHLSVLCICFLTRAALVKNWLSEPSQGLHRNQSLTPTFLFLSFLSRQWSLAVKRWLCMSPWE